MAKPNLYKNELSRTSSYTADLKQSRINGFSRSKS